MRQLLFFSRSISYKSIRFSHIKVDDFSRRVKVAGFQSENHKVTTDDGYILTIHRLLPKNNTSHKGSAFLMHGLFRNSADFIASGPKISLAYYLADSGFDVWLGNARGSVYSKEHKKLDSKSSEFWNFSFHEIGIYDLPSMLNFILDHNKATKTFYVGHSQGCAALLALLSSFPEWNQKIAEAHLLTPSVILRHASSPMLTLSAKHSEFLTKYTKFMSKFDISPALKISQKLARMRGPYDHQRALKIYKRITCFYLGENKREIQISEEALESFQTLMSPEVSTRQLLHFLQLHTSQKFQQFDFGDQNLQYYNLPSPPEYNLNNVTAPVHLYSASEDIIISPKDVEELSKILPNVRNYENIEDWNHVDVMLGKDSKDILYKKILKSMIESLK